MKLSISNIAWKKEEYEKIVKLLKLYGYKAIEAAPTILFEDIENTSSFEIKEVKEFWKKNGIDIIGFQSLLFGKDDFNIFSNNQKKILDYLKKVFEIGNNLGIKIVVFGSPKNRLKKNLSFSEAKKKASDFFYKLAELGKDNNIIIALEPNPKQYGADFIMNTDEALDFIEYVNHKNLRLNLDSGILTLNNEDLEKNIKRSLPYLSHFHISEPYLGPVGKKNVNHLKIASILKKNKYSFYCSIEMKAQSDNNLLTIENALKFVKEIYG
jgi:sugar phosphate isomerase/epimerase